ncbi:MULTISPECIES: hypothetical protein [Gordonia]|uniref:Tetratricopeptide repeat protein n=1 Tax=Gordonia amicalis TaxID=89053 RepID=A0AAE4U1I6_9ACTN|nr:MULTISPECIES: hypothetical protein [Gordonia]ATD72825.1 hypothetical protein CNO18_02315 [Gordonia sp. 1D]MCZ0911278.1 hypothetical protein [Gordonia amicalis]MCZ4581281.1 hypothetical protein [Gordonia amicalis]MCZ4650206.1 hypothetical protein [Gordonia amicalis]MDJ0451983.1 hypothetical protein [Gordonia amicalis]
MIEELQAEAEALLAAGEYEHALAAFSVLREVRARREGPYSTKYLSNLHDCVRCMSQLQLWMDANYLCSELHGKYVRTHGRGEADTVDVAKHWAWALVNLHDYPPAIRLYLMTADALWDVDPGQAQRLLGAAVIHRHDTDPLAILTPGVIDGVGLHHADEERTVISRLVAELADTDTASRSSATIDGFAIA